MLCKAIKKFHISKCKNLFWVTSATAFFKFPNQHRASYPRHPPRTSWTVTSGQPHTQESSHNLSASKYSFRIPQSHGLSHLRTFLKVLMEQAGHAISLAESFCQLFQFITRNLPFRSTFYNFFSRFGSLLLTFWSSYPKLSISYLRDRLSISHKSGVYVDFVRAWQSFASSICPVKYLRIRESPSDRFFDFQFYP